MGWLKHGYDRLVPLYKKYWSNVIELKNSNEYFSNPHLICFTENYEKQKTKLFTVGQQTGPRQWHQDIELENGTDSIEELMEAYYGFYSGCYYGRSPFFQAIRKIESMLGITKCESLVSEIDKMDFGGKAANPEMSEKIYQAFPVLPKEIKIAKPDVVIFFTGKKYDKRMKDIFPGAEFQPVIDDIPREQFARIIHPDLPPKTFRTYHPFGLRTQGLERDALGENGWFETVLA